MNTEASQKVPKCKLKIVLLAGFGQGSRKILNTNKSFLKISGVPLFVYVLRTILSLNNLERVVVVGPLEKVILLIDRYFLRHSEFEKIFAVNQGRTLYESVTNGIHFFYPPFKIDTNSPQESGPILFLPGDIPLLTKREIEVFLEESAKNESDYCIGIVSEKSIKKVCSQRAFSELKILCYPFREGTYRINNLHLLKLIVPGRGWMIDRVYQLRYLSNLVTLLPLTYELFKRGCFRLFFYIVTIQGALILKKNGFIRLVKLLKILLPLEKVEREVGKLLGIKISAIEIFDATAAMDIDTDNDYYTIKKIIGSSSDNNKKMVRKGGVEPPRLPTGS